MIMFHYVVVLSHQKDMNDFNREQYPEKMKKEILNTVPKGTVKNIETMGKSPVLYVECTENSIQKILNMDNVDSATYDGRYPVKTGIVKKHPKFFDGFKRKGR